MQLSWLIDPPLDLVGRILKEMDYVNWIVAKARARDGKRRRAVSVAKTKTARQSAECLELTDDELLSLPRKEFVFDYAAVQAELPHFLRALVEINESRSWGARTEIVSTLSKLEKHLKDMGATFDGTAQILSQPDNSKVLEFSVCSLRKSNKSMTAFVAKYQSHTTGSAFHIARELDAGLAELQSIILQVRVIEDDYVQETLHFGRRHDLASEAKSIDSMQSELSKCAAYLTGCASADALHHAFVDFCARRKSLKNRDEPRQELLSIHGELVSWIRRQLNAMQSLVDHLKLLIEEFDRLEDDQRNDWIQQGSGELGQSARQSLVPFLKKGRDPGMCTELVRELASLYRVAFDRTFRVHCAHGASHENLLRRLDAHDLRARRSLRISDYRIGQSVIFACAVIRALELDYLAIPFKRNEIGAHSEAEGRHDVQKYNREAGLHGLRYYDHDEALPVDKRTFDLIIAIGNGWQQCQRP